MSGNAIENSLEDVVNDPAAVIGAIMQEVHAMGANDSEISALDAIRARWNAGDCTAQVAIQEARAIQSRKQDYH